MSEVTSEPMEPSQDQVVQSEIPDLRSVPVTVETPVRTQPLGGQVWAVEHWNLDNTLATKILNANPKRSRALISVRTQIAYIAPNQQRCTSDRGFLLPAPSVTEFRHTGEVWAIGGAGAASEIATSEELWTQ